jgi:hypothetical protein
MRTVLNLKVVVFITSFLLSLNCLSQTVVTDSEMDKKYAPNENSIFNTTRKKGADGKSYVPEIIIKNSVKFCPTMLVRQKALFVYERKIKDGFSASFGLGKAFGDDLFQSIGPVLSTYTVLANELRYDDLLENSTYFGSRPMLYTGLKIYFSGNAFEGGFLEFTYRREAMDYAVSSIKSINFEGTNIATFKTNAFTFGFGFSGVSGKKDNITHEFFMNVGLKSINYSRFEKTYIGNTVNTTPNDFVYRLGEGNLNYRIVPSMNMGYMFGFGF